MEFLKPNFSESELHVKSTLHLSDQDLHRLQQEVQKKIARHKIQKNRTVLVSSFAVAIAAVCVLAVSTTSNGGFLHSFQDQSSQGSMSVQTQFATTQESDHWSISLVPVLDRYTVEIKPKDTQIRQDVTVQLVNSFSSSGANVVDGQSITYKDFSISDSVRDLQWVITWKDGKYQSHSEKITFSRE